MHKPFALAFALLASARATATSLDFAILGDSGEWNASTELARGSIERAGVNHLILPGDNLYSPDWTYASVWDHWSTRGFTFDVVAIGNHNGGYPAEIAFFGMPGEFFVRTYPGLARFVVLNSDNTKNAAEQARFLDRALAQATEPFVFVVFHHPSYTLSHFHGSWEKAEFHKAVRPVLFAHRKKLTALIVGHDHLATLSHFDDLPVVLSGAAMEQRKDFPLNYATWDQNHFVRVRTDWFYDHKTTWTRLHLDDESRRATISYVRANDDAETCTVNIESGKAADLAANCDQK